MARLSFLRRLGNELRRRGVVQVVISYAVVVFILLQVAEITFEPLGLPAWTLRAAVVVAIAGFPVVDVSVELHDGKYHDVDSDAISFQLAAERACVDAFEKGRGILLEPIMDVVIQVPDRFTGDVAGSLSSHRGRLSGMEVENGIQTIQAQCPLATMLDYSTQLRSITAGEGSFTMRFAHYEPVPPNVQADVVKRHAAEAS